MSSISTSTDITTCRSSSESAVSTTHFFAILRTHANENTMGTNIISWKYMASDPLNEMCTILMQFVAHMARYKQCSIIPISMAWKKK